MNRKPKLTAMLTQKSDEGAHPNHREQRKVSRANSAVSLPVDKQLRAMGDKTPYQNMIDFLETAEFIKGAALGHRFGFYRLCKPLGSGNFSKVKLGSHLLSREKVAVKIMDKGKMDEKAKRLLRREIDSMEKMNHPNIIKLFECAEDVTRMYLVLEYASGGELYTHIIEQGKLSETDAKPLYAQIVSAVSHMHSRNLVHRDIKAENIMFSNPKTVKVGDFGFSCISEEDQLLQTFCGSPPYAAPELFRDKSYSGPLVDVWALGCLLYFMLVGSTPFKGETVSAMKKEILAENYQIPEELSAMAGILINGMLRLDVEKRADILWVKKNIWMRDCRFTKSYLNIETHVDEEDQEEKKVVNEKVWERMNNIGISEDKVIENLEKGPRDAIIGTYRIVQYQVHQEIKKAKEQPTEKPKLPTESSNQSNAPKAKVQSKTCSIM